MRCRWVNTSKPSARATAQSVIPAASAMRTANAVGAEIATNGGAPMLAVFCTNSTETRLVSYAVGGGQAFDGQVTGELVERIVASDILAHGHNAARRRPERSRMHRAGLDIDGLQRRNGGHRRYDRVWGEDSLPVGRWRRMSG